MKEITPLKIIIYNYQLIAICIFISTSAAYFFPEFIRDYGFLGYDLPMPQVYHSHPYFFILWIFNLMGAVSICLIYHIICSGIIMLVGFAGRLYFQLCSFVFCGSDVAELAYVLFMIPLVIYSSLSNIVIVLIIMHFFIMIQRGKTTRECSLVDDTQVNMFQIIALG